MTLFPVDLAGHPIDDRGYMDDCRGRLAADGALVLEQFFTPQAVAQALDESRPRERQAYYASATHNVYLTDFDADLGDDHVFNRQIVSTKGLIADDQIPPDSPLRQLYDDPAFRAFLCSVLGIDEIHAYADPLSSVNVHFASAGRELGWHFDNSSFAVTMLLQAPDGGGVFEYVPGARCSATGDQGFDTVAEILNGHQSAQTLCFAPGDLVLFRGRDALHRVTPTEGATTRVLVVFAYNDQPGVSLSDSALATFYGRNS